MKMNIKEISEGNKILSAYMNKPDHIMPELMKYHTSWDWLMPVVEKIEEGYEEVHISCNACRIVGNGYDEKTTAPTKIKAVWLALVKFIPVYYGTPA